MLVLFETPAGFALFKVLNEKKLKKVQNLAEEFETLEKTSKIVKLKCFKKFQDAKAALQAATSLSQGMVGKSLKRFLKKNIVSKGISDTLLVIDRKLRSSIQQTLGIKCLYSSKYIELIRGIRQQIEGLIAGFTFTEQKAMSLGLAHSMCRQTLKFSIDKIDTMVVQAVSLIDDLDKQLNNYAMRLKEWYSWHFPELVLAVSDNLAFAKCVRAIGKKENAKKAKLKSFLPEEIVLDIIEKAQLSMGTQITESDITNMKTLCDQVITLSEYRVSLSQYLKNRMQAIAPNLTVLVGELVGARLIAHAGSLVNLSKHPASTIQILGAQKALFRAIKTEHETPKYGLIFHASIIGNASSKIKGKISRSLAAKCALSIRLDALGEESQPTIGLEHKQQIESRTRYLESVEQQGFMRGKQVQAYKRPERSEMYSGIDMTQKIEAPLKREMEGDQGSKKKKKYE